MEDNKLEIRGIQSKWTAKNGLKTEAWQQRSENRAAAGAELGVKQACEQQKKQKKQGMCKPAASRRTHEALTAPARPTHGGAAKREIRVLRGMLDAIGFLCVESGACNDVGACTSSCARCSRTIISQR